MKNPICISTGLIYKFINDRNEMISELKEFSPDGIELSFASPNLLLNFKISNENLKYLRGLKFNSIHAPWKDICYKNNSETNELLKKIESTYHQIRARNVVFHKGKLDNLEILKDYNFLASIENDDWRKGVNTPKGINKILMENTDLKFTFDFAHALTVSPDDIPVYINQFKNKIIQFHLSYLNKNLKDHYFLHKYGSKKIRVLLGNLKSLSVPLVLECVASYPSEVQLVKQEIEYLRSL